MIRVAIFGCGKAADKHAMQLQRVAGARIISVCDSEILMAGQLAERFGVPHTFSDPQRLLDQSRPDVVHIITPPRSHYNLAKLSLESGCHVYVEKPFTETTEQAAELIRIAERRHLKLTVGHETQFTSTARDLRQLVAQGYLGGNPVHIESLYCYDFSNERYARALLGDRNHWVRSLKGGLLQNIISHGIGKIVEFLRDDQVTTLAHAFTSSFLISINETDIFDELRVIISDQRATTAYFTFSSQIGPALHQLRVYGPRNSLVADYEHRILIKLPGTTYRSYINQFIPPMAFAAQHARNGIRNLKRFLTRELHSEDGIFHLIQSFYQSITADTAPPISHRDILLTSRIMDAVFAQIGDRNSLGPILRQGDHRDAPAPLPHTSTFR